MVVCGELDRELNDPCILRLLAALEIGFPMLSWGGGGGRLQWAGWMTPNAKFQRGAPSAPN